jgi:hypothetical protein
MSAKGDFFAVLAAGSVLLGMTTAKADQQQEANRSATSAPAQVAILPAPQPRAQDTRAPLLKTLRPDSHWPQLKECIANTATPEAFRACLQNAFGDMAGERVRP